MTNRPLSPVQDYTDLPLPEVVASPIQLAELLEYLHIRVRRLLASVKVDDRSERVSLDQRQWQNLLDLQARLAAYLRAVGDPN